MKVEFHLFNRFIFILFTWMLLTACTDEISINKHTGDEMTIRLQLPASVVVTRGETGTVPENRIGKINVLLFDSGTQVYKRTLQGRLIGSASGTQGNTREFMARLPEETGYDIVVVANHDISVLDLTGKTKDEVQEILLVNHTGEWDLDTMPIPMWGKIDNYNYMVNNQTVLMTRMLARVQVDAIAVLDRGTLILKKIHVCNYNQSGTLIPLAANFSTKATAPSLPGDPQTDTNTALEYSLPMNTNLSENQIYLFEAEHAEEYTPDNDAWKLTPTVILQGRYTGDAEDTYYRMDFIDKEGKVLDILRNHTYKFIVKRISGPGRPSIEDALNYPPINLEGEVINWEDNETGNIWVDGLYSLTIDKVNLGFSSRGVASDGWLPSEEGKYENLKTYFSVTCDYPDGWTISEMNMDVFSDITWYIREEGTENSWRTFEPTDILKGNANVYIACGENKSYEEILTGDFTVSAGRMNITVNLKQTKSIYVGRLGGDIESVYADGKTIYRFEKGLYIREDNELVSDGGFYHTSRSWAEHDSLEILGGVAESRLLGKKNTLELIQRQNSKYQYRIAQVCYDSNKAEIQTLDDSDYIWYAPAQAQLAAVWSVRNATKLLDNATSLTPGGYWSSTKWDFPRKEDIAGKPNPEGYAKTAWGVNFKEGYVVTNQRYAYNYVRCVRERDLK